MEQKQMDSLIGLMADAKPELLIGLMAILKSGSGYVPINPEFPLERINFVINDSMIEILVTETKYLEKALQISRENPLLKHVVCLDEVGQKPVESNGIKVYDREDYQSQSVLQEVAEEPEQLIYVIYTSGSTGQPKGVAVTHQNLLPLLRWSGDYFGFSPHTKVLQTLSYCFDFGAFELLTTMLFGGQLHFLPPDEAGDPLRHSAYIHHKQINTVHSTPTFFRAVAAAAAREREKMETLEVVHLGGEAISGSTVEEISRVVDARCAIYNGYGPTEASINCAIYQVDRARVAAAAGASHVPIGRATANSRLFVLDRAGKVAPVGVVGELYVGGLGVARGYWRRAELTAERFVPDWFSLSGGERLYRTGDLVRYSSDGLIEFIGRADGQVKVRGFRIELGEIEAALSEHPAVRDAVVMAREERPGNKHLTAYVVLHQGEGPSAAELRRFLAEKLPDYMLPSFFVMLDAMPLTPNQKIDRRALPMPDEARAEREVPYTAPRTETEEILAGICAEVLGREKVGIHDNFFQMGGHSLLATQAMSRLRSAFGIEIPLRRIFEEPTVAGLAAAIVQSQAEQADGEEMAQLLAELDQLSEEEAQAILAGEDSVMES